eukprot:1162140-Rhodomonas_salina.1
MLVGVSGIQDLDCNFIDINSHYYSESKFSRLGTQFEMFSVVVAKNSDLGTRVPRVHAYPPGYPGTRVPVPGYPGRAVPHDCHFHCSRAHLDKTLWSTGYPGRNSYPGYWVLDSGFCFVSGYPYAYQGTRVPGYPGLPGCQQHPDTRVESRRNIAISWILVSDSAVQLDWGDA